MLYDQLAQELAQLIRQGVYCPGDKLPSIRHLSKQKSLSISTVQRAFEVLESMQLIEIRQKSGAYIKSIKRDVSANESPQYPLLTKQVTVHQQASDVFHQCGKASVANLGTSYPSAEYFPIKQLQSIMGKVVRGQMRDVVGVEFSSGHELLRRNLARRMNENGCQLTSGDIIVTNGCLEALSICLRAVVKPGDTIAIESPGFVGLLQLIESMGIQAVEIPCHPKTGLSLDALELAIEQWDIKAVAIVPTFSNPIGSLMPESHRRKLVKQLAEKNIPLIEDDIFSELAFDGGKTKPCKAFDEKGLVLYCSSMSKTIASGFRIGWISPGAFFKDVEYFKTFTNISAPNITQMVMAEFLESGRYDRHLRQMRTLLAKQAYKMQHWLDVYLKDEVVIHYPEGGCALWLRLPEGVDGYELHKMAIKEHIGIVPGKLFSTSKKYDQYCRLNFSCDLSIDLDNTIKQLAMIISKLKPSTSMG